VEITLLPSNFPRPGEEQSMTVTSYVVNGVLAIDAGSLGLFHSPQEQARIRNVLLTHTHADHIGSLPLFVENVYEGGRDCVVIHGSEAVLDCLRRDVFNDRVWPDFIRLSRPEAPFLRLAELRAGVPLELAGLRITPVPVNHVVPTLGFILEDQTTAVVVPSDTGPTEEVWERANGLTNLKAVFLEAAFPNAMKWLADVSKHLTPEMFAGELRKLRRPARVFAVHIKPRYQARIGEELKALGLPNVEIAQPGHPYVF
jgi:ribonuclease BN (tRNA processing enzyme)